MDNPGPARLVREINSTTATFHSAPKLYVTSGTVTFFVATDQVFGTELWRTDGTGAGTRLVKDLSPGPRDSYFLSLKLFNGFLYMRAIAAHGVGLYRTDGTPEGTSLVRTLPFKLPPPPWEVWSGEPIPGMELVVSGPWIYFTTEDSTSGPALWRTDGTDEGTTVVRNFKDSAGYYSWPPLSQLTALDGALILTAEDATSGAEVWRSDGTDAGTTIIREINPSQFSSLVRPHGFNRMGNAVYLFADDGTTSGPDLWRTDGTAEGTFKVKELSAPGAPSPSGKVHAAAVAGDTLFFTVSDGLHGVELWKSDGTDAGTAMVRDVNPGSGSGCYTDKLLVLGERVFFRGNDGSTGNELWTSDGTGAGTVLVRDMVPGADGFDLNFAASTSDRVFFTSGTSWRSSGLWYTDGSATGTVQIASVGVSTVAVLPETARSGESVFFAGDPDGSGTDLWISDGTAEGTRLLKDITPPRSQHSFWSGIRSLNGVAYFGANDGRNSPGLWRSDGTAAGTWLVKSTVSGTTELFYGFPDMVSMGGRLYFRGNSSGDPWFSDGTSAGTVPAPSFVKAQFTDTLAELNGITHFIGGDGSSRALYRTDGSVAGTVQVSSANTGFSNIARSGEHLYFAAPDYGLMKSDGTDLGTTVVRTVSTQLDGSNLKYLTTAGNLVFYVANVAGNARLFRSDGTDAGTWQVGGDYAAPESLTPFGSVVYFTAHTQGTGTELWRSDGTTEGTFLLADLLPGPDGSSPSWMTVVGEKLYFFASTDANAHGLWKTDGTAEGTVLIYNAPPGTYRQIDFTPKASRILPLPDGRFLCPLTDEAHGEELWISDGTAAGTALLHDIQPGPGYSRPVSFCLVGSSVFFVADDGVHGKELWQVSLPALGIGGSPAGDWGLYE